MILPSGLGETSSKWKLPWDLQGRDSRRVKREPKAKILWIEEELGGFVCTELWSFCELVATFLEVEDEEERWLWWWRRPCFAANRRSLSFKHKGHTPTTTCLGWKLQHGFSSLYPFLFMFVNNVLKNEESELWKGKERREV